MKHSATVLIALLVFSACLLSSPALGWSGEARKSAEDDLASGDLTRVAKAKAWFAAAEPKSLPASKADRVVYYRWKQACCDFRLGDSAAAENRLEQLTKDFPADGLSVFLQRDLGEFYLRDWKLQNAREHLANAVRICNTAHNTFQSGGKSYPIAAAEVLRVKLLLADSLVMSGDNVGGKAAFDALRAEFNEGSSAPEKLPEDRLCLLADYEIHRAELARRQKDTYTAISTLEKCMARLNQANASPKLVRWEIGCTVHLANNYGKVTRFADGEEVLAAGIRLLEKNKGVIVGTDWFALQGDLQNTLALLRIEQSLCEFEQDPRSPKLAALIDGAEKAATAADDACKKSQRTAVGVANSVNSLAVVHEMRGRILEAAGKNADARAAFQQAKRLEDDSIQRWASVLPHDHDILLELRLRRAGIAERLGDHASAWSEASEVLRLYTARYGDNSLECLPCHELLIEIESNDASPLGAADHAAIDCQIAAESFPSYAAALSVAEEQTFFRRWDDAGLQAALRLGTCNPNNPAIAARSAEWLLNGKAKAPEILAMATKQARSLADASKFADFLDTIQAESYALYGPATVNPREELLRCEAHKRKLVESRSVVGDRWHPIGELCKCLHDNEAYIDIYCVRDNARSGRKYYAWVLNNSGSVKVVDLGDADSLDTTVSDLLHRMERFGEDEKVVADDDEQRLKKECLTRLGEQILRPLRDAAGDKTEWIISPDGSLISMPWPALIWPGTDDYSLDHVTYRTVISGREVLGRDRPLGNPREPLILANPDYNDGLRAAERSRHSRSVLPHAPPLPNSELEGRAIADALKSIGDAPELLLQQQAAKDAILQLKSAPRILYLATHGFFRPGGAADVHDPFLRCGVELAGANVVESNDKKLRGILTAAEMLTVDLNGTDLVVLSACESGNGITTSGQSGMSFRHACHLAGARAVVASLWPVEDVATKALMVEFVKDVGRTAGASKAAALRKAQQRLKNDQLGTAHTRHPFYWAAFILSGF